MTMRHHMLFVLCFFTTGSLSNLATPFASRWEDVHVKHQWDSVPVNWTNLGHPPADTTIDLHIALKAQNENALIDALYEVSSPDYPKYGKHLSKEQVAELIAPPQDGLDLVNAWLEYHGVLPSTISSEHGGSWLTIIGVPVSQANNLLTASYQLYQHSGTNMTVLRTLSYKLPEMLLSYVQTVAPTTQFGFPRTSWPKPLMRRAAEAHRKTPAEEPGTGLSSRADPFRVTPDFLRWLYHTSAYVPTAAAFNVLGIVGYNNEYPSPTDLMLFMKQFRADATFATYSVALVNGGAYNPNTPAEEPNLNIEYAEAISFPTRHIFYSSGNTWGDPALNWLHYLLSQQNVPQTISTSYGHPEYLVSLDYATLLCNLYAQLGLRGASVLAASGDDGVGKGNCQFKDSSGNLNVRFLPTFPSTCPWVTSVGGTTGYPEEAAVISGGGFSVFFPQPPYQDAAVPPFLQNLGSQYYDFYNPAGRGIPDIALQAMGYRTVLNGRPWIMDGTSGAAPVAAGIIALLNDYMITTGRKPLGFLNPWLYGGGLAGLNDITRGSNPGCNTPGFSAGPGWDPVTGLGTLDFAKLGELLSYGF